MKYTWLVEKYLEGELSGKALSKFELDILTKPEVAREVERIRNLNQFMQKQHRKMQASVGLIEDFDDLDNILNEQEVGDELEGFKIRNISSSQDGIDDLKKGIAEARAMDILGRHRNDKVLVKKVSIWIAASSLAVLIAVSSLLLIGSTKTDYSEMYNQFYHPRLADIERTVSGISDNPYQQAMNAYSNADYARAFHLFNSIPENEVSNKYYLFKGITAMELGEYSLAVELFDKLDSDVILRHEGMWYKSLCYLGMEDVKSTRRVLNEIIESNGHYKAMAGVLLRKL